MNGPVDVPGQARRVVTLDSFTRGAAFDIGRTPVGVYSAGEPYVEPQFVEKWRPITKISMGTVGGSIDLEKVATLKRALGLGNALHGLQQRYADRAAAIKRDHADVLAHVRWDIIQGGFDQGQFWVYGPKSPIGGIHADAIFYYATNANKPANLGPELFGQKAFTTLPATKANRLYGSVYFLPNCYSDAVGALDALEKALSALK
ncbi:hypothetical protein AB0K15_16210 [Amycolatopsis sp. NPDC049253]|uniref:hypothetical protein n=1 Tax=Amycolatopsis sp. NPDC049253 TaxID=3155274 RepID=UPI003431C29E